MKVESSSAAKPFQGTCPSCGRVGLVISGDSRSGFLSCPGCNWNSSPKAEAIASGKKS